MYHYDDEDWGENYENWYDKQWDTGEEYAQQDDAYEAYPTEQDYEQEQDDQEQEDDLDEDDQDNYELHEVNGQPPTMDIYMSELRISETEKGNIRN
jgi:hypothetical protein